MVNTSHPIRIDGITRSSLWNAWKKIRGMLRRATLRDVVDHLEYDVDPDVWINQLLREVSSGTYEPRKPVRFKIAKSKGFSRRMTMPAVPDLVLYRAIADFALKRLKRREHKHVYFERSELRKAADAAVSDAEAEKKLPRGFWGDILRETVDYETSSRPRFRAWLRYSQYRRYLIFKRVYPFIVTTDIANFFDSVLHDRLAESFHSVSLPPRMIGLLFFLLERLSLRDPYSESRRIGLPVDEFDCSRQLAHLALFAHDDRIVAKFDEEAYVRWMDDQNIGVSSYAEGLEALALVGDSLARLNLTPNSGKSRILAIGEARSHFHLEINDYLDKLEDMPSRTASDRRVLSRELNNVWRKARKVENDGEWEKILKRVYRFAGLCRGRFLRRRSLRDVLTHPQLTRRIADYMRASGKTKEYLEFVTRLWECPEQLYDDVNITLVESLLLVSPSKNEKRLLRQVASSMLAGKWKRAGFRQCCAVAPLLLLRYGDRRSLPLLRRCFALKRDDLGLPVVRSAAIVYASYGLTEYRVVRKAAAGLLTNPLSEMVRLIERIREYSEVPGSYKQRVRVHGDNVAGRAYIDMRAFLAARLLKLNPHKDVRDWLLKKKIELLKKPLSQFDNDLIRSRL